MSDGRTTWSLADETAARLESVADRKDHESANDFVLRVAAMLDDTDNGMDVTKCDTEEDTGEFLTAEEFVARMDELQAQLPQRTADELETRFR